MDTTDQDHAFHLGYKCALAYLTHKFTQDLESASRGIEHVLRGGMGGDTFRIERDTYRKVLDVIAGMEASKTTVGPSTDEPVKLAQSMQPPMASDAELQALVVLIQREMVSHEAANFVRALRNEAPTYDGSEGPSEAEVVLRSELKRRGLLP